MAYLAMNMTTTQTCAVEGCGRPYLAKGWCSAHYARVRKHGHPQADKPIRSYAPGRSCNIPGCARPHVARGWCDAHYARVLKHGDPQAHIPIGAMPTRTCAVVDCEQPHQAQGWCAAHYSRVRKHGDPHASRPLDRGQTVVPCSVDGCKRMVQARGLCSAHYNRVLTTGGTQAHIPVDLTYSDQCQVAQCTKDSQVKGMCRQHYTFSRDHHLTPAEVSNALATKSDCCDICKVTTHKVGTLHYDHCHITDQHRGWLCGPCNRGLGLFQDDPGTLQQAAQYVEIT